MQEYTPTSTPTSCPTSNLVNRDMSIHFRHVLGHLLLQICCDASSRWPTNQVVGPLLTHVGLACSCGKKTMEERLVKKNTTVAIKKHVVYGLVIHPIARIFKVRVNESLLIPFVPAGLMTLPNCAYWWCNPTCDQCTPGMAKPTSLPRHI